MSQKKFINYGVTMFPAPPPVESVGSWYFGFLFEAKKKGAVQSFLDRTLNTALGKKRFKTIDDFVMLNISRNPDMKSPLNHYAQEGIASENDIGFWIPVLDYGATADQDNKGPVGFGMMPAFLFVDRGIAVTAGREVWGMPKIHAHMTLPEDISSSFGRFESSVYGSPGMAENLTAEITLALALQGKSYETNTIEGAATRPLSNVLEETLYKLGEHGPAGSHWQTLLQAVADYGRPFGPNCYMLKQFRAANSLEDACYQEVIRAQLAPTNKKKAFDELFIDVGEWKLLLPGLASLPFAKELGLLDDKDKETVDVGQFLKTKICLRAKLDYTITSGYPL